MVARRVASYINDPKKIIAYSTISQLGIISIALGIGLPFIALFHLITHAIFKALIFISIGIIIAQSKHKQIISSNKLTLQSSPATAFKLATIALNAFPFTSGFYSKDLIIESIITNNTEALTILIFIPVSLTALYRLRLIKSTTTINNQHPLTLSSTSNTHSIRKKNYLSKILQIMASITAGASIS